MRIDRTLLKFAALILLVVAAILFFLSNSQDVAFGLASLGIACSIAGDTFR